MWCRLIACLVIGLELGGVRSRGCAGGEIRVPQDHATVAGAIAAAQPGDTVVISPGVYREQLELKKPIALRSTYESGGDRSIIARTILDGTDDAGRSGEETILKIRPEARGARIYGLTFAHGDDGISCEAEVEIASCRFVENDDAIDYEGGGGVCVNNLFLRNGDDAIDLDGDCHVWIHHNRLIGSKDDGIEIRLEPTKAARRLEVVIESNLIEGSGEDGIQFIDYEGVTDRVYVVSGNEIRQTGMAGIGFMSESVTKEDYRAAAIPELIVLVNNTIEGAEYGVSGSGPMVLVNHVVGGCRRAAFRGGSVESRVYRNVLRTTNQGMVEGGVFSAGDFLTEQGGASAGEGMDVRSYLSGLGLTVRGGGAGGIGEEAPRRLGASEITFGPDVPLE